MASALASPPPPFSFGSADLKANARKFLERALVISALIHFSAVGLFRAAEERSKARWERDNPAVPKWEHPVDLGPRVVPIDWSRHFAPPVSSDKGVFDPTGKDVPFPTISRGDPPSNFPGVAADPRGGSVDPSPGPGVPPEKPEPAFKAVDTPPVPLIAPKPVYSDWLREAGIEGKVLLRVLVGTDGFVKQVVIASGPKGLGEEAAKAVRRWTFRPGLANGNPIEVWVEIPIAFQLGE